MQSGRFLLLVMACVGLNALNVSADLPPPAPPLKVLARFPLPEEIEDGIVVPVRVGERELLFLVDTGSGLTVYDESIELREAKDSANLVTPNGTRLCKLYEPPPTTVAGLPFSESDLVTVQNLTKFREISGQPFYGILGVGFFKQYVLRLDFEHREMLIYNRRPPDSGEPTPMKWKIGRPYVNAKIDGSIDEDMCLDTGMLGNSFALGIALFDRMQKKGKLRASREHSFESMGGAGKTRSGYLDDKGLTIGGFDAPRSAVLSSLDEHSYIGLRFLSRFVVTFDFQNDALYLRRSKRDEEPEVFNLSGLTVRRGAGRTIVDDVAKESAAERARLRKGDVLVRIGEKKVSELSLYAIYRLINTPNPALRLEIASGEKTREVTLSLKR